LIKNEKGVTLIEVLIALAVLGIVSVAFLSGLATSSKAIFVADEIATSESLARSQMEYVKKQAYNPAGAYDPGPPPSGGEATYDKSSAIPDGYTIWSVDRAGATVTDIIGVPWDTQNNQPSSTDEGIQKIKLVIKHHGDEAVTLEDYKVDR
jgi:prepilin-type N-terminal cleavage/methylation domain-containing protein